MRSNIGSFIMGIVIGEIVTLITIALTGKNSIDEI